MVSAKRAPIVKLKIKYRQHYLLVLHKTSKLWQPFVHVSVVTAWEWALRRSDWA